MRFLEMFRIFILNLVHFARVGGDNLSPPPCIKAVVIRMNFLEMFKIFILNLVHLHVEKLAGWSYRIYMLSAWRTDSSARVRRYHWQHRRKIRG